MFVKLLTDVNGLYILWVSAEMAYNFYNISAGNAKSISIWNTALTIHVAFSDIGHIAAIHFGW